ncbi:hypothetical protein Dimus_010912, partial [Dionaea muscipula]
PARTVFFLHLPDRLPPSLLGGTVGITACSAVIFTTSSLLDLHHRARLSSSSKPARRPTTAIASLVRLLRLLGGVIGGLAGIHPNKNPRPHQFGTSPALGHFALLGRIRLIGRLHGRQHYLYLLGGHAVVACSASPPHPAQRRLGTAAIPHWLPCSALGPHLLGGLPARQPPLPAQRPTRLCTLGNHHHLLLTRPSIAALQAS